MFACLILFWCNVKNGWGPCYVCYWPLAQYHVMHLMLVNVNNHHAMCLNLILLLYILSCFWQTFDEPEHCMRYVIYNLQSLIATMVCTRQFLISRTSHVMHLCLTDCLDRTTGQTDRQTDTHNLIWKPPTAFCEVLVQSTTVYEPTNRISYFTKNTYCHF